MPLEIAATGETLQLRARLLARIRSFFQTRGVLEVETPALSSAAVPDPALESIEARVECLGPQPQFLHTSPEYAMKRLLAAGNGDIFQLCRVFRDGELGRWHQPEFTLLEWYRVGWDECALMDEVEALLRALLAERALGDTVRVSYRDAFNRHLGLTPDADPQSLADGLREVGMDVPPDLDRDALLDLAMAGVIVPRFDPDALTFVTDFPPSQAALALVRPGPPAAAARFELFYGGLELANGFAELTDPAEQRARFEAQQAARKQRGQPLRPLDEAFLAALDAGLPPCAGVAVGVDRVVALAGGLSSVAQTMSLAHRPPSALPARRRADDLDDALDQLLEGETDLHANAANFAAWLYRALDDVNWVGFYWMRDDVLVLGPFQGEPAVTRIPVNRGVCGVAAARREVLNVPCVSEFEGHIICDPKSRSELVVPLLHGEQLVGVLDIDSPRPNRFSSEEAARIALWAGRLLAAST